MIDYKKVLRQENTQNILLEIAQSENRVDICGNKDSLLHLACRLLEFVEEDCQGNDCAEMNIDIGVGTTENSSHLCVYLYNGLEKSKGE